MSSRHLADQTSTDVENGNTNTFTEALEQTRLALAAELGSHGHWEGYLSSSALATATAVIALDRFIQFCQSTQATREQLSGDYQTVAPELLQTCQERLVAGRQWLVQTQNEDGGWGDTVQSFSNISTTAVVWAALADGGTKQTHGSEIRTAEANCERWLRHSAGSLEPNCLADAISKRYGRDRTFSVPILTALAITGRLGPSQDAWRRIVPLPFEVAALPHQCFSIAKLPVVSYALPALIAMGQLRHKRLPSRNPLARLSRNLAWNATQRKLEQIQPRGGGFLEATPLTSFVVMALLASEATPWNVIRNGIDFLIASACPDGSWPIDTNLATWTTTLAVNAISSGQAKSVVDRSAIQRADRGAISDDLYCPETVRSWLLTQQYKTEHPFTHAKAGGWAWTDLPGGVPDADDTSGAILALKKLSGNKDLSAASDGLRWLAKLQNRDGGMPTFCRGWGTLPFDRSSNDITAHAIRAWVTWLDDVPVKLRSVLHQSIGRGVRYLAKQQSEMGSWSPLWFGNQHASPEENRVYGTSRVLLAIADLIKYSHRPNAKSDDPTTKIIEKTKVDWRRATEWLQSIQNEDGGWGGEQGVASSIEETGLAVEALAAIWLAIDQPEIASCKVDQTAIRRAVRRGVDFLIERTEGGTKFPASPIGFYFAKLWYFERLYPVLYTLAALEKSSLILNSP